ncbi:hypothetical protein M407DRAFT_18714 [Tulasnella calospora MUT 4182]|uniref:Uncharacterized protein n=1 Tax=Tulasnella calospora MUT 4182 TaxID=1051891 RepID=A0A0C3LEQ5_9AGAM|nr:hypothetical protein M407DRAFT_18714 [Tulasnella calospora MUT 4182]
MNFKLALAALLTTSVASVLAAPAPVAEPAPNPIAAPAPQVTCSSQGQRCNATPAGCCAPYTCHEVAGGAYGFWCY